MLEISPETLTQQTYLAISQDGDAQQANWGWERFVRRFRSRVKWRSRRCGLGDADAEDCANSVMKKMLVEAPHFYDAKGRSRQTHSFQAFLLTTTDRMAVDIQRLNQRSKTRSSVVVDLDQIPKASVNVGRVRFQDLALGADFQIADLEFSGFGESLLLGLKELCRRRDASTVRAFLLRAMTDMTWEEIARETGLKPNTAMKAYERCREFLRKLLGDEDATKPSE